MEAVSLVVPPYHKHKPKGILEIVEWFKLERDNKVIKNCQSRTKC